jgi:large subunit ribosomal protein L15
MRLNTLQPAKGAKKHIKRLGRGIGSGHGKTASKGHKGQHARSGGYHKVGFEGGQMPLQRRLPKRGFRAPHPERVASVRLGDLNHIQETHVTIELLKKNNIVPIRAQEVKIYLSGKLERPVQIVGIKVSKGAREAIIQAGGSIAEGGE